MIQGKASVPCRTRTILILFGLSGLVVLIVVLTTLIASYNFQNGYVINQIKKLDENFEKWIEADIENYEISVQYFYWTQQFNFRIIVKNDEIIESTINCYSIFGTEFCENSPNPSEYTVIGLFNYLVDMYNNDEFSDFYDYGDPKHLDVEYSPEYGYPISICYDHPEWIDDQFCIVVKSFTVLE